MAYHYTLRLSGIQGESEMEKHENEIDLDEVIQDYEAPSELDKISLLDRSEIKPAVNCRGITVFQKYDKSTPNLLDFLTSGKLIDKGAIHCYGSDNRIFLTIALKQLIVRQLRTRFDQDKAGVEVNFSYTEINHSYTPQGKKEAIFNYKKEIPFT